MQYRVDADGEGQPCLELYATSSMTNERALAGFGPSVLLMTPDNRLPQNTIRALSALCPAATAAAVAIGGASAL